MWESGKTRERRRPDHGIPSVRAIQVPLYFSRGLSGGGRQRLSRGEVSWAFWALGAGSWVLRSWGPGIPEFPNRFGHGKGGGKPYILISVGTQWVDPMEGDGDLGKFTPLGRGDERDLRTDE